MASLHSIVLLLSSFATSGRHQRVMGLQETWSLETVCHFVFHRTFAIKTVAEFSIRAVVRYLELVTLDTGNVHGIVNT